MSSIVNLLGGGVGAAVELSNAIDGVQEDVAASEKAVGDLKLYADSHFDELSKQLEDTVTGAGGAVEALNRANAAHSLAEKALAAAVSAKDKAEANGANTAVYNAEIERLKNDVVKAAAAAAAATSTANTAVAGASKAATALAEAKRAKSIALDAQLGVNSAKGTAQGAQSRANAAYSLASVAKNLAAGKSNVQWVQYGPWSSDGLHGDLGSYLVDYMALIPASAVVAGVQKTGSGNNQRIRVKFRLVS